MPAKTEEAPLKLPLAPYLQNRQPYIDVRTMKDARLINGYAEYDAEAQTFQIQKRFGLFGISTPTPGAGLGIYSTSNSPNFYTGPIGSGIQGRRYSIVGTTLYEDFASTALTVDGSAQYYFTECISQAGGGTYWNIVMFNNGASGFYAYVPTAVGVGTLTHLDPLFGLGGVYGTAKGIVYLDGTTYIMDYAGNIYGSPLNNIFGTWSGLNVVPASITPDPGVMLTKQLSYVVALKAYSTQIFYDAGNPTGSPLSPVQGAYIPYGCLNADSVKTIDTYLIWMTANQTASPQIIIMENLQTKIISTPGVDRLLSGYGQYGSAGAVYSWVLKHSGHRFYGITLVDINMTLVFDIDQNLWYIWTGGGVANNTYWPVGSITYNPWVSGLNRQYVQNSLNGKIYVLDEDYIYPTDDGTLFPVDLYTASFDAGVDRRKLLSLMRVHSDQVKGSSLAIRYSEDDYLTWSNFRKVDLSLKRPFLDNCGTFHKRAWHFRHLAATPFRMNAISLQMDIGTL
jgi:hypothetical protein